MNRGEWLDLVVGRLQLQPEAGWDWEDEIFGWIMPDYSDRAGQLSFAKHQVNKFLSPVPPQNNLTFDFNKMQAPRLKVGDPIRISQLGKDEIVGVVHSIDHETGRAQIRMTGN